MSPLATACVIFSPLSGARQKLIARYRWRGNCPHLKGSKEFGWTNKTADAAL
jgi:hypothetical protein